MEKDNIIRLVTIKGYGDVSPEILTFCKEHVPLSKAEKVIQDYLKIETYRNPDLYYFDIIEECTGKRIYYYFKQKLHPDDSMD